MVDWVDWESGPTGRPMGRMVEGALVNGVAVPLGSGDSFSDGSSARSRTSANMPLSRSHFMSFAFEDSTTILCFSTLSLNHDSSWFLPFSTSSVLFCRARRRSELSKMPCQRLEISKCLLILSIPSKTSSSEKPVPGPPPTSLGISPR